MKYLKTAHCQKIMYCRGFNVVLSGATADLDLMRWEVLVMMIPIFLSNSLFVRRTPTSDRHQDESYSVPS